MDCPSSIADYLRRFSSEIGERVIASYPALYSPGDPLPERLRSLLRRPFNAQAAAATSIVARWRQARAAAVIAECGTGKSLIALASIHVASAGRPYRALVLAPGNIVPKWCREVAITIPGARIFVVGALRNAKGSQRKDYGINEVRYRNGRIVYEGLHTTLTDVRLRKNFRSAKARWQEMCRGPAFWIVARQIQARVPLEARIRRSGLRPLSGVCR